MTAISSVASARLPGAPCPLCGTSLVSDLFIPNANGGAPRARDFRSCLRRCSSCGIGLSNADTAATERLQKIDRNLLRGLPDWLRDGCEGALARSLNVTNRPTKRWTFQSWGSEDQITWVVFRYLQAEGQLRDTLAAAGLKAAQESDSEPTLLYWGAAATCGDPAAEGLRARLVTVLNHLGEDPQRYTEPDLILEFGSASLVFLEIKLGSANDMKLADYAHWGRYVTGTPAFRDPAEVLGSGLYQLARNWRVGWELAGERPFTLVNLGPARLTSGRGGEAIQQFEGSLSRRSDRHFQSLTWQKIASAAGPLPDWLEDYLRLRGIQ